MNWEQYFTVRDLMNYIYCPRILYFERVLHIPQATTVKEYRGREFHKKFNTNSKRAMIADEFRGYEKKYDVFLEDSDSGFRTVLDCLMIDTKNNSAYVLQAKDSFAPRMLYRTQKFQLFAEAYLVRKVLGLQIYCAYVKYLKDKRLIKVRVGAYSDAEFLAVLSSMRETIKTEEMPEAADYLKKCADCGFYNICKRV
ncbi:MAG: CRISPR-associated protein Cas4 [Candidatus Micrarchaeia archaeon]